MPYLVGLLAMAFAQRKGVGIHGCFHWKLLSCQCKCHSTSHPASSGCEIGKFTKITHLAIGDVAYLLSFSPFASISSVSSSRKNTVHSHRARVTGVPALPCCRQRNRCLCLPRRRRPPLLPSRCPARPFWSRSQAFA